LEELRRLTAPTTTVVRDGVEVSAAVESLVVCDVVRIAKATSFRPTRRSSSSPSSRATVCAHGRIAAAAKQTGTAW
jgi:hypothetical protein